MERATQIVIELLGKGTSQAEVARLTGNTPSAISQVALKYPTQIAAKGADASLASGGHSAKLDRIEELCSNKLESLLVMETDIMKVTKVLQTVNASVRRDQGEVGGSAQHTNQTLVQLNVPSHLARKVEVITNTNNDVVAVDGRDLTPATIKDVNNLAGIDYGKQSESMVRTQAIDEIMAVSLDGL